MPVDLSVAQQAKDDMNFEGIKYLKLGPGKHVIRILPPPEGMPLPWRKYKTARCGPNEVRVTPPSQYDPQADDPTVTERERLLALGDEASKKRADDLRWRDEYAMFVIKRGEEAKGPQLWTTSKRTVNQLLAFFADPDVGDYTDPNGGIDITVEGVPATGGKRGTEYTFMLKRNSTPLGNMDWTTTNLFEKHKIGRPSDADYIRAALEGNEQEFKAKRKAEWAAKKASQNTSFNPEEFSPQTQAVNVDAVKQVLENIKNRGKKAAEPVQSQVSKELQDID